MTTKATSIVCYLTLVGWIIAYLIGDKEGARFHLNQALVLLIGNMIIGCIAGIGLIAGGFLTMLIIRVLHLGMLILWILALVDACRGRETPLPLIKDIQILK